MERSTQPESRISHKPALLFEPETYDWSRLTEQYGWIGAMQGVPQNPAYHAEGDVWIHTGMVARALLDMPEWQALPPHDRALLYASALLHDVAKPVTTEFDENGIPSSPRHTQRGEPMARVILEECGIATYADREAVAKLVRYHGLPLWFLEKPDMPRAIARASQDVRLDWLALLAEADVRGRECADKDNLLDTISLFRDTCRELECYNTPRRFAADHARFMYFRNPEYSLDYTAFDDRRFTVTLLCGLPGAGKSTWIQQHNNGQPIVSLDDIRLALKMTPGESQAQVIEAGKQKARDYLRREESFFWNATNLTYLVRDGLIDLCTTYGARIRIVVCHASLQRTLLQNSKRDGFAHVPSDAIRHMLERFAPPSIADCHELVVCDLGLG